MNKQQDVFSVSVGGKITVESKHKVGPENLPLVYTPGVADVCMAIAENSTLAKNYTIAGNTILVVSDGSAVLGLGNIGPKGALPVMEGKALLFKELANVNAFPIVLNTQDTEDIIQTIKNISPGVAGINLEDISAPRCFEIETKLKNELDIPVFHDDQHGTAIVVLAGLINSAKVVNKDIKKLSIIISGSGSAGVAVAKLLHFYGISNILVTDSKGIISSNRTDLNDSKKDLLKITNSPDLSGSVSDAVRGRDVFIGVSTSNVINEENVRSMADKPIIFAMSNPIPEITPEKAFLGGAYIVATGSSKFPNQINNVLVFPGLFRGLIDSGVNKITNSHMVNISEALANLIENPDKENIIPSLFDKRVVPTVASVFK